MGAEDFEMAAGDRGGDGVGSGLDAVGDQIVAGVVKGIHALHQNPMRSGTLDARSHRGQAEREVADFGIARRVQDLGFAARERSPPSAPSRSPRSMARTARCGRRAGRRLWSAR